MKNDSGIDSKGFAGGTPALPGKGFRTFTNCGTASKARTHLFFYVLYDDFLGLTRAGFCDDGGKSHEADFIGDHLRHPTERFSKRRQAILGKPE